MTIKTTLSKVKNYFSKIRKSGRRKNSERRTKSVEAEEQKQWKQKNKSSRNGRTKTVEIEFVTANPISKQVQQKSTT